MVELISDRAMNRVVSHLEEVRHEVSKEAEHVADRARARLAPHTKTGRHRITTTHEEVDSLINFEGPAVESVEYGHWVEGKYKTKTPKFVPGLYILTGAAMLDTTPKQGPRRG